MKPTDDLPGSQATTFARKGKVILFVAGLILAAFGLGVWVGSRSSLRPSRTAGDPLARQSAPISGSDAESLPSCVDIRHVGPLVGKEGCVAGLVLRVYFAKTGNTFLDFCENYRACPFSSVIFASDKDKFGNLQSLQGRRVEIRGDVVDYQGRAEIVIRDPRQVRSAP